MSPRRPRDFLVLGFDTTHDALAAEEALRAADFAVVPIPAPKAFGKLCGIALRLSPEVADAAECLLKDAGMRVAGRVEVRDL